MKSFCVKQTRLSNLGERKIRNYYSIAYPVMRISPIRLTYYCSSRFTLSSTTTKRLSRTLLIYPLDRYIIQGIDIPSRAFQFLDISCHYDIFAALSRIVSFVKLA